MSHNPLFPSTFSTLAQLGSTQPAAGTNTPVNPQPETPAGNNAANNPAAPIAGDANQAVTSAPGSAAGATSKPKEAPPSLFSGMFLPITLMLVLLYFVLFRGQRKEEKKRKAMVAEMKKGDQVMTIGGMVARVVSIDGDSVTLKIDESANVKAVYMKSAIQKVITADDNKAK